MNEKESCEICMNENNLRHYMIALPRVDISNDSVYVESFATVCESCLHELGKAIEKEIILIRED